MASIRNIIIKGPFKYLDMDALLDIFFLFMQRDYGKFILKQLDYSPSFSTAFSTSVFYQRFLPALLLVENSGS